MQALRVCVAGLHCLRATTLVLELGQYKVEPFVVAPADLAPPDPITPKLLPSVHLLWSPLIGALKVPIAQAMCQCSTLMRGKCVWWRSSWERGMAECTSAAFLCLERVVVLGVAFLSVLLLAPCFSSLPLCSLWYWSSASTQAP